MSGRSGGRHCMAWRADGASMSGGAGRTDGQTEFVNHGRLFAENIEGACPLCRLH